MTSRAPSPSRSIEFHEPNDLCAAFIPRYPPCSFPFPFPSFLLSFSLSHFGSTGSRTVSVMSSCGCSPVITSLGGEQDELQPTLKQRSLALLSGPTLIDARGTAWHHSWDLEQHGVCPAFLLYFIHSILCLILLNKNLFLFLLPQVTTTHLRDPPLLLRGWRPDLGDP